MFARIVTMKLRSNRLDEAAKLYKETIIPVVKSQKGFNSNYFCFDRETGKAVSVAFWDSKQDIIDDEESGQQQERLIMFKDFLAEPFTRDIYEIGAQS